MDDLVSIITPSYNTGKFISETIESVLKQTYTNWEMIIIDDHSTDHTVQVMKNIKDKRIIFKRNKTNCGAAVSRNRALKLARGRWIAFLDSDDVWHPKKLERQIKFMKENNYYFSYTNYEEVDEGLKPQGIIMTGPKHISKFSMYYYCWPGCLTVMYDQKYVGKIQIPNIKKNNDYAMWLKIIKKTDCWLLDECLAMYRKREGSISNHSYSKLIKWHFILFHNAESYGVIISFILTITNIVFGIWKKIKYRKVAIRCQ